MNKRGNLLWQHQYARNNFQWPSMEQVVCIFFHRNGVINSDNSTDNKCFCRQTIQSKKSNDGYKWLLWNPWSYDEIYSGWREVFLLVVWRLDIADFFAVLPNTRFVFVYPLIIFTLLSSQFGLTKIRAWSGKYWRLVNCGCSW